MAEKSRSFRLHGEGLDHWQAGRLDDAEVSFRGAIEQASAEAIMLPEYYGSLARVLDQLGKHDQPQMMFEKYLELSIEEAGDRGNSAPGVAVARYFLASHFLQTRQPSRALAFTEPSVGIGANQEGILRNVRAHAFHDLGEPEAAKEGARAAIRLATSEGQRERMRESLAVILGPDDESTTS